MVQRFDSCIGSVQVAFIHTKHLMDSLLPTIGRTHETIALSDLTDAIKKAYASTLEGWRTVGVEIRHAHQLPQICLWMPHGYLTVGQLAADSSFDAVGLRKTVFIPGATRRERDRGGKAIDYK